VFPYAGTPYTISRGCAITGEKTPRLGRPHHETLSCVPRSSRDKTLGAVLRGVREERGLTQEVVAFHAGITTGTLARLELGDSDPSWSTIRSVANALDLSLQDLAAAVEAA